MDLKGLFMELELRNEKWFSEELVPTLDYKRNTFFLLNNGSKCKWNIWDCFSQMMALLGWKTLYAWYYVCGTSSGRRRERKNACVCVCILCGCVPSSHFESIYIWMKSRWFLIDPGICVTVLIREQVVP